MIVLRKLIRRYLYRCLALAFLLGPAARGFSQSPPKFELVNSQNGQAFPLLELHASVRVIGDRAETTFDMTFLQDQKNEAGHGQIDFQLPDGAMITRFAMDVDGNLTESVVVEKDHRGPAPQAAIPQKVPGETQSKTGMQTYRATVIPMLPGREKRVLIAWEEKMKYLDGDDFYRCPLHFNDVVRLFSFEAIAENQPFVPIMKSHPLGPATFKRKGNAYRGRIEARNYLPDAPIELLFPVNPPEAQLFFEPEGDSTWFYLRNFVRDPRQTDAQGNHKPPSRILLAWDVSYSGVLRDHAQELDLLDQYLALGKNMEVEVVTFADRVVDRRTFAIKNHRWEDLRDYLGQQQYDGASLPSQVNLSAVKCHEVLLFSDGGQSCGAAKSGGYALKLPAVPVYAIASSPRTETEVLDAFCAPSGGKFLDLAQISVTDALAALSTDEFRFISAKFPRGRVSSLCPAIPTACPNGFSLAGAFRGRGCRLELRFGYGDRVSEKLKYDLRRPESHKITRTLHRVWAREKLKSLLAQPEMNAEAILALGLAHRLATPLTTHLVPASMEDHLRHGVVPLPPMQEEYRLRLLMREEEKIRAELERQAKQVERLEEILYQYLDRIDWYEEGLEDEAQQTGWLPEERQRFRASADSLAKKSPSNAAQPAPPDSLPAQEQGVLRGRVLDQDGSPLPGAVVRLTGTDQGSYTDQEGRFFIRVDSLSPQQQLRVTGYIHHTVSIPVAALTGNPDIRLQRILPQKAEPDQSSNPQNATLDAMAKEKSQLAWQQPDTGFLPLPEGMIYVLDGVIQDSFPLLKRGQVKATRMLHSDRILFRYGIQGLNGMFFIFQKPPEPGEEEAAIKASLELPAWDSAQPWLDSLRRVPSAERYVRYLELRERYGACPGFYVDVADHFIGMGREAEGLRILSNLAEFDLERPEPLRTFSLRLQVLGREKEALALLQRIWREFPDEPQSWRDLALARAQDGQVQEAVDLLNEMLRRDWSAVADLYEGIEQTALAELNALLAKEGGKSALHTDHIDQRVVYRMPVPLRVTVDWNRFETDVDLLLVTPAGDTLGLDQETDLSFPGMDMVDGYGPEEILLREAAPGQYRLLVNYFDESARNEMGATWVRIKVVEHFGEAHEATRTYGARLDQNVEQREVLRFWVR